MAEAAGATAAQNDINTASGNNEQFNSFFQRFLAEQSRHLIDLRAAATAYPHPPASDLQKLVERVVSHYEDYYQAKAAYAQHDITMMFSPTWTSSTEDLFMWAGGWRPTAAFHLLYSKSSLQLEARLEEILQGMRTANLGNLSAVQLQAVDGLHRSTIKTERAITEKWAAVQEEVAAKGMVEIAAADGEGMEGEMEGKRERALSVLQQADKLRIDTIKGIVGILDCFQAVHFLIAAAELHLAVHKYGRERDDATFAAEAQTAAVE
ncbi:hypothetical protein LUZ61_004325 [Rhynchospora tenuis]|uniref:DOG1 domain-containing protein n=1 Tax=Rhynchospora tenuis TaxID=198213 RepID=A0AAD5ZMN0_9POAL|nr:hypothetical protein LUZ61_004325 [Rhynchospora tenuis]